MNQKKYRKIGQKTRVRGYGRRKTVIKTVYLAKRPARRKKSKFLGIF